PEALRSPSGYPPGGRTGSRRAFDQGKGSPDRRLDRITSPGRGRRAARGAAGSAVRKLRGWCLVSEHSGHIRKVAGMGMGRYVVDAVLLEGRSAREVARAHGISKTWIYELIRRYR